MAFPIIVSLCAMLIFLSNARNSFPTAPSVVVGLADLEFRSFPEPYGGVIHQGLLFWEEDGLFVEPASW